jgi:integrase
MVNTGLRPDEAWQLQFRDVEIVRDTASKETILEISVRGKRGVGYCKSMPGAVLPFKRLQQRLRPVESTGRRTRAASSENIGASSDQKLPEPTELVFPFKHRELWNSILDELGLKEDREGNARTAYSLRHSYISMRLMEGADIYQVAKNCRTSVEMIEKHYAAHIKHMIDASSVNIRRPKISSGSFKRDTSTGHSKFGRGDHQGR